MEKDSARGAIQPGLKILEKISIAQAELERIKENRKITKKGKRNRAVLAKECKGLSATKLVSFMEKQKAILRKLKRGFSRSQKNEEARILNQQFQTDTSKVYANMRCLIRTKRMNDRDTQRVIRIHKRTKKCLTT